MDPFLISFASRFPNFIFHLRCQTNFFSPARFERLKNTLNSFSTLPHRCSMWHAPFASFRPKSSAVFCSPSDFRGVESDTDVFRPARAFERLSRSTFRSSGPSYPLYYRFGSHFFLPRQMAAELAPVSLDSPVRNAAIQRPKGSFLFYARIRCSHLGAITWNRLERNLQRTSTKRKESFLSLNPSGKE